MKGGYSKTQWSRSFGRKQRDLGMRSLLAHSNHAGLRVDAPNQMGEREKKLRTVDQKESLDFSDSGLLVLTVWMEERWRTGRSPVSTPVRMTRVPLASTNRSWRDCSLSA